jgi:hypothetical protein
MQHGMELGASLSRILTSPLHDVLVQFSIVNKRDGKGDFTRPQLIILVIHDITSRNLKDVVYPKHK